MVNQDRSFAVEGNKMHTRDNFVIYKHIPARQSM